MIVGIVYALLYYGFGVTNAAPPPFDVTVGALDVDAAFAESSLRKSPCDEPSGDDSV